MKSGPAKVLGRPRVTPAQSLSLGFALLVVAGALLLRLPVASRSGAAQDFVDALFTATSAVTTTGLVVVDTATYYSLFGQWVILALFQLGGLGYMVFIAFLALLVGRRLSLATGVTLEASMAGFEGHDYMGFIGSVFWYTLAFEAAGTVALSLYWMREASVPRALYLGLFHSVSAFCTAGFALYPDSFVGYRDSPTINVAIAVVTIAGALGFFVLRDVSRRVQLSRAAVRPRRLSLHSRLTLTASVALMAGGTAILLASEPTAVLGSGPAQRFAGATFQALSASTTTGFNSIDIGAMSSTGLFTLVVLMFVGASPGGTGGGIKTTTLAAVLASVNALLRGGQDAMVFGRRLTDDSVRRAWTIGLLATLLVTADTLVLTATERQPFLPVLFEVVSAFGTVGLSTGITSSLSAAGKIVLSLTMLVGRLGPLAIGFALLAKPRPVRFRYAEERIFIG
jgi:trk system potassium uptake protein TrkH